MVSVKEFQEIMRRIYFNKDSKRGAEDTHKWLEDEVKELGEALQNNDIKAIENEFADVFAWLTSLANVLEIDLERATLRKYENRCPKCGSSPCECPFRKRRVK